ncbi:hypothetical protein BZG76_14840 [Salinivibrio sp. AR647]|uniref:hypothetical protein n=1 Tax=Salinivibrio sp. AR647 TaxID=1909438 RepID=UPI000986DF84|nr:hypothetical protein [Salinivibrio sp. AR647]OOE89085.1 hypothetical protein BZG76_14840 [Salinivibrio sp. AR647]
MKRVLQSLKILEKEPEQWMAYLHGQKFEALPNLQKRPQVRSKVIRFLAMYYKAIGTFEFFKKKNNKTVDYLFLAGTTNQKHALIDVINKLVEENNRALCIYSKNNIDVDEQERDFFIPLSFTFKDLCEALVLNVVRCKYIHNAFKFRSKKILSYHLNSILSSQLYLVFFIRILEEFRPSYIVLSNDHSTMNRALIAVAHENGIKTVYLQHASVSNIFPALNFNYSFLDGRSALETYRECKSNCPSSLPIKKNQKVFLSGQKKRINKVERCNRELVGIAPNSLDEDGDIKQLVEHLIQKNYKPLVRWHPGLGVSKIEQLKSKLGDAVSFSDPRVESLNDFFNKSISVVAGNSSILFEAALAGLTPIYYQITESTIEDYYGYVEKGIAIKCDYLSKIDFYISEIESGKLIIENENIRYFSSTYDTEWFGKEGELVASILMSISGGEKPVIESTSLDNKNAGNTMPSK